jgi:hypothetical protein
MASHNLIDYRRKERWIMHNFKENQKDHIAHTYRELAQAQQTTVTIVILSNVGEIENIDTNLSCCR